MIFRTPVNTEPSEERITYSTPVMFTGSCFAVEIGRKMAEAKMKVLINPTGTVFNPVSTFNAIDILLSGKSFAEDDLIRHDDLWHSFYHYTDFSSEDPAAALLKINRAAATAREFLKHASFLFVTFGTSSVFRFRKTGMIVSNCHKLPPEFFIRENLAVEDITGLWMPLLGRLRDFNSNLKTVFTISPVRYLSEGAHANQVSKAVLFLAVEKLLSHSTSPGYFPAYEIFMDDLRDYRFYADDMIHPSGSGINYVFSIFRRIWFSGEAEKVYSAVKEIMMARNHRVISPSYVSLRKFAETTLNRIDKLEKANPDLDFNEEKAYFSLMRAGKV